MTGHHCIKYEIPSTSAVDIKGQRYKYIAWLAAHLGLQHTYLMKTCL